MVLLIDNYDSFTYNLAQYLGELGADVQVRRNDAIDLAAIRALAPSHIVISPGPGRPEDAAPASGARARRSWACAWAIRRSGSPSGARSCARPTRCTARSRWWITTGEASSRG
jgi:hypothetical protein